jgi:sn-glycerol 3-phosphate transport system ATP-binding protein
MNLVALDDDRIAGSTVDSGLRGATTLGVRPESITLAPGGVPSVVQSVEYLGADLVLRCAVGSQALMVRADGRHIAQPGDAVGLHWEAEDAHGFDADGNRID